MRHLDSVRNELLSARVLVRRVRWALLPLLVMLGLACFMWGAFAWFATSAISVVLWAVFAFLMLIFLLVLKRTLASLTSSNWIALATHNAVIVKTDAGAVEIPFAEIASVRKVSEQRLSFSDDDSETVRMTHVYVELSLSAADVAPLGGCKAPVTFMPPGLLRIAWSDAFTRLTPPPETFIAELPPTVKRLDEGHSEWRPSDDLSDAGVNERIKTLCASGDKLEAIKLARVRFKFSLKEAKDYVEKLIA